jgi:hypothetical protein
MFSSRLIPRSLPMKMEQSVPKRRHIKFRRLGIPRRKHTTYRTGQNFEIKKIKIYSPIPSEPVSSVGIATDYGLTVRGSNPGGGEIFRPSGTALGPTQPPVQWVPGISRGEEREGRGADHAPPSSAKVLEE